MWVQEFLRELVVGIATPSDLAGLFLVEILHCSEGEDVEQMAQTSKQILPCLRLLISLYSLVFNILHVLYYPYLYLLDIVCICAHISIQPREL